MLWESQHSLVIDSHGERKRYAAWSRGLIMESGDRQTFVKKLVQSFATWMTLDRLSSPNFICEMVIVTP